MNVVIDYLNIDVEYLKNVSTRKEVQDENNKWNEKRKH